LERLSWGMAQKRLGNTALTEMSTRNLPVGKGRQARGADNLTAICGPIVWKMWSLDVSQPSGSPRPVTWIAFFNGMDCDLN
jgi:hypothetical protein